MNKQILLIDDDEDEQSIFMEALDEARLSWNCFCANSAKQGFELLDTLLPDYIFLDINMPGMNGFECLRELKTKKELEQIPVIMYSTAIDDYLTDIALKLGAANCIKKNSSVKSLAETLKEVLGSNSSTLQ